MEVKTTIIINGVPAEQKKNGVQLNNDVDRLVWVLALVLGEICFPLSHTIFANERVNHMRSRKTNKTINSYFILFCKCRVAIAAEEWTWISKLYNIYMRNHHPSLSLACVPYGFHSSAVAAIRFFSPRHCFSYDWIIIAKWAQPI